MNYPVSGGYYENGSDLWRASGNINAAKPLAGPTTYLPVLLKRSFLHLTDSTEKENLLSPMRNRKKKKKEEEEKKEGGERNKRTWKKRCFIASFFFFFFFYFSRRELCNLRKWPKERPTDGGRNDESCSLSRDARKRLPVKKYRGA